MRGRHSDEEMKWTTLHRFLDPESGYDVRLQAYEDAILGHVIVRLNFEEVPDHMLSILGEGTQPLILRAGEEP